MRNPTTINVDNGTAGNNNNRQANTTDQGSQPGSMIQNIMLSASTRSANASTGTRQDEVTINSTTYRSVNNTVRYRISQQGSDNKARGSLIDGGANGVGARFKGDCQSRGIQDSGHVNKYPGSSELDADVKDP